MREKLIPWLPAIFCTTLSLITVIADVVGRLAMGTPNVGLTAFLCFLPMCFFHVGVALKALRDENRELKLQLEEMLQKDGGRRTAA